MAGNETRELEFAAPGKPPDEFTPAVRQNTFRVWVVVLHVRMLFHEFRMFAIFHGRREDEFVILLAVVLQNETDLFPPSHLDSPRFVAHFPVALEHLDVDDPRRLLRIAALAGRETSVILTGGCRDGHCDIRRQDCGA